VELGHEVTLVEPDGDLGGRLRRRLIFNVTVPRHLRKSPHPLVVGFDLDGLFTSRDVASRYVVSLKGVAADEQRFERGVTRARLWATGMLERWNAQRALRVIVSSRYARDRAVVAYALDRAIVRVVPEGIPFSFWTNGTTRAGPHRPTIVSVARFYPRKNLRTLLAALPAVLANIPEVMLRLVGAGPEEASLRAQAASLGLNEAVEFLGPLADPCDVRDVLHAADVFCLPSLQEAFGIGFLEAMAVGLPVVAGDTAAVPEVVPHGEAGYLIPPCDVAALANVLIRLLGDPALRRRLGDGGRQLAARYDWPIVAARFLEAALSNGADT